MTESASTPEWLEDLPSDWETAPLKSFVEGAQNGLWGDPPEDSEHTVYCARVADFNRTGAVLQLTEPTVRAVPPRKQSGRLLQPGDLLLEKSGGGEKQPVGYVVLVESLPGPTICSNFVARMPVKDAADSRYVRYLHQHFYSRRINTRSIKQSTGIQNLDARSYLSELAPRPPLEAQQAIANFLDRETAKIDTLIEKKQRLLELLEEKRTALITRAVTRGLDPDVPMKDSGVEWIGEVPEHWDVASCRSLFQFLDYRRIPLSSTERGQMKERTYPYYGASGVIDFVEDYLFDEPLLLVAEDGANLLNRSTPLAFIATGRYWVNNHAHVLRPRVGPLRYWEAVLRTVDFHPWVKGAAQPKLTQGDLGQIRLPVPPSDEQQGIAKHVAAREKELDTIGGKIGDAVELLQEYRTALISAAVTGQIDVSDKVPA